MEPTQLSFENRDRELPRRVGDLPPGIVYRPEVLTTEDEAALLQSIDANPWATSLSRRVQHYGWRYDYTARRVDRSAYLGPLPSFFDLVVRRIPAELAFVPDQAIVNEYEPGQGIAPHIDCEPCFGPIVVMLGLASDIQIDFDAPLEPRRCSLLFERRGLLALTGPSRFEWKHGIAKRRSDATFSVRRERRLSVTFRTVRVS